MLRNGLYVAVKFNNDTINRLQQFIKQNNIPNGIAPIDIHATVVVCDTVRLIDFKPLQYIMPNWKGTPIRCGYIAPGIIAITFGCLELTARNHQLVTKYKCAQKFDNYMTHVTLSYNAPPGIDVNSFDTSTIGPLYIVEEYAQHTSSDPFKGKYLK